MSSPHDHHPSRSCTDYLYAAMQLEHATIPPYLTALYSIHPGTNADAYHVLRVIAVEEMLHLTLAANLLNAVGGTPDLTAPGLRAEYPAYLPGRRDRLRGEPAALLRERRCETFLKIERPARGAERVDPAARPRTSAKRSRLGGRPGPAERCSSTASASSTTRSGAGCTTCTASWATSCSAATPRGR